MGKEALNCSCISLELVLVALLLAVLLVNTETKLNLEDIKVIHHKVDLQVLTDLEDLLHKVLTDQWVDHHNKVTHHKVLTDQWVDHLNKVTHHKVDLLVLMDQWVDLHNKVTHHKVDLLVLMGLEDLHLNKVTHHKVDLNKVIPHNKEDLHREETVCTTS